MDKELSTDMIQLAYRLLSDLKLLLSPTMENFEAGETVKIFFKEGHHPKTRIGVIRGIHPRNDHFNLNLNGQKYGYSKSDIERFEWINTSHNALIIKINEVMSTLDEAEKLLRLEYQRENQRLALASLSHSRLAEEVAVADVDVDVLGHVAENLRQVTKEQIQTAKEKYSHIDPIINFARIVGDGHKEGVKGQDVEGTSWTVSHNSLRDGYYFYNNDTKESLWDMPGKSVDIVALGHTEETARLLTIYRNLADVTRRKLKFSDEIDEIGNLKLSSELEPEPGQELEPEPGQGLEPEPETILSAVVDESLGLRGAYKNIKRRNKLKKIKSKKRKKIKSKKLKKIKSKKIKLNKHKSNKSNYKKTRRNKR